MKSYIAESALRAQNSRNEYLLHGKVQVVITEPLPKEIDIASIIKRVQKTIPKHLLADVDSVYIGNYAPLNDRQVDSLYINGSIMITNNQPNSEELYGTFIHEIAHAAEEIAKDSIYGDGKLAREFIAKRKTLFNMLKDDYKIKEKDFVDIDFNPRFDQFAYKEVGYDNLGVMTSGLFISPYACTSLREYFANGFEHYFIDGGREIREVSPVLYRKVQEVIRGAYLDT